MVRLRLTWSVAFIGIIGIIGLAACGTTIHPNDDTTVRPGQGGLDEWFGLLVKYNPVGHSYIEFTLGSIEAGEAILSLYNYWTYHDPNQDVEIRGGVYAFDETTLTWESGPDTSGWPVVAGPFTVSGPARWYDMDITDFYNAHLGETVTFHLYATSGTGDGPVFVDREGTDAPEYGFYNDPSQGPSIEVTPAGSIPPVIKEVSPDPDSVAAGTEYQRRLELSQGTPPVSWSVVQGPTGLHVDQSGLVSGWTPGEGDIGELFTIETEASNAYGSDTESWQVQVVEESLPLAPKWEMFEVPLTASSSPANPFTDTTLTATLIAPGGRVFTVDGFYDGDGAGGQSGSVWKLRFSPDEPGIWEWMTSSGDPGLNGMSGRFRCIESGRPGPIVADGRYFRYADGGPVYLIGNFLDRAAPSYEEYSHTLLSEEISETNRQNMIARHRDFHKANKINIYLANRGDYGGISTTPWVGSSGSPDRTRFDLGRWKMYDRIITQLAEEEMIAELWFYADDSGFGDGMSTADRRRLIQYGLARLSAYPHTMFVLCLEWQEGWSSSTVINDSTFAQSHNPWKRLWSVHGTTGDFSFPGEPWADFMATQLGNSVEPPACNSHTIRNRALAAKPLIVEEFGILESTYDRRLRGNLWAAFCGGAAGSGTGSDLPRLGMFIEDRGVAFSAMEPHNSLSSSGFVLAEEGAEYVVYVENGGTFTLQLAAGSYEAEWFSPRASDGGAGPIPIGSVGGGTQYFTTPNSDDWVLHVFASTTRPHPRPAGRPR